MIILKFISSFTLVSFLVSCQASEKVSFKKPNIILINVDDLGYKDLGFMGSNYYETPNLDAFAKEGAIFLNAYAGAANCAPSRACMLSGLNTPKHGVFTVSPSARGNEKNRKLIPIKNTEHLTNSIYTLPKMLKSAGYITASFGKWHVGEDPTHQGIDFNVGGSSRGNPGKAGYFSPYNIDFIEDGTDGEYLTDRLTQEAISFIEKNKDTTFFVYMPFYTIHTPIMGKPKLIKRFKQKSGDNGQDNPEYAAMVNAMDENVGLLLQKLEDLRLKKNTLIIFTSDNGGIRAISEQNPLRAGKGSYYEGGIRVPLIIRWPEHIKPNTIHKSSVSQLDFYPTLQHIVNPIKKAKLLEGKDIMAQIVKDTMVDRNLFFHFPIYLQAYHKKKDQGRDPLFRTRPGSVIISGDWKLHHYFEDDGIELYNLSTDVGEQHNLAKKNPKKTQELLGLLNKWRTQQNAPIPIIQNPEYDSNFVKS